MFSDPVTAAVSRLVEHHCSPYQLSQAELAEHVLADWPEQGYSSAFGRGGENRRGAKAVMNNSKALRCGRLGLYQPLGARCHAELYSRCGVLWWWCCRATGIALWP